MANGLLRTLKVISENPLISVRELEKFAALPASRMIRQSGNRFADKIMRYS
jgi:hypothetical protein